VIRAAVGGLSRELLATNLRTMTIGADSHVSQVFVDASCVDCHGLQVLLTVPISGVTR
jgi:hypothetical protein